MKVKTILQPILTHYSPQNSTVSFQLLAHNWYLDAWTSEVSMKHILWDSFNCAFWWKAAKRFNNSGLAAEVNLEFIIRTWWIPCLPFLKVRWLSTKFGYYLDARARYDTPGIPKINQNESQIMMSVAWSLLHEGRIHWICKLGVVLIWNV